jgi:hypothetical protein
MSANIINASTQRSTNVWSKEPEMMFWPSGENAELTYSMCPVKGPATISPVMEFYTRIVSSEEPEMMCWSSGENATDETQLVSPVKGPAVVSPVMTFHTQIVLSCEPEAKYGPSGENATTE